MPPASLVQWFQPSGRGRSGRTGVVPGCLGWAWAGRRAGLSRHSAATAACKPASSSISILSAQRGAALVNSFSNFRLRASCGPPLLGAAQSTRKLFRVESLRKQVYLFFEERGKQSWRVAEALSPAWPAARPGHGRSSAVDSQGPYSGRSRSCVRARPVRVVRALRRTRPASAWQPR